MFVALDISSMPFIIDHEFGRTLCGLPAHSANYFTDLVYACFVVYMLYFTDLPKTLGI
jgi:hypothetical protein